MDEEIRRSLGVDTFPMPFSPPSPPVYKIVHVPGFGLSMIATADIARGQVIARERPLLVMPQCMIAVDREVTDFQEELVNSMLPENRAAVYALQNVKGPEWPSHLKGIIDTNALGIHGLPGYPAMYFSLARDISRVNHRSALRSRGRANILADSSNAAAVRTRITTLSLRR